MKFVSDTTTHSTFTDIFVFLLLTIFVFFFFLVCPIQANSSQFKTIMCDLMARRIMNDTFGPNDSVILACTTKWLKWLEIQFQYIMCAFGMQSKLSMNFTIANECMKFYVQPYFQFNRIPAIKCGQTYELLKFFFILFIQTTKNTSSINVLLGSK